MFWRTKGPIAFESLDNIVWYGRAKERRREVTQWMDPEFYEAWEAVMQEAFDLLGMMDRFQDMLSDSYLSANVGGPLREMNPVVGQKNRHLLRKTMMNVDGALTAMRKVVVDDGYAVCHYGNTHLALDQWKAIAELLGQTTVMTFATQGLQYYVEGSQVGYTPATRHLFRRGNTVERIGLPNKPHWLVNVSGYRIEISGKWDELKQARKEYGYNMFQMLQLRLNEELEKAVTRG